MSQGAGSAGAAFDGMLDALEAAETSARRSADEASAAAAAARAAETRTRAFLSDAAHELRTPLAGIQAAAEQITVDADPADARGRRRAALLLGETRRAARLVGGPAGHGPDRRRPAAAAVAGRPG